MFYDPITGTHQSNWLNETYAPFEQQTQNQTFYYSGSPSYYGGTAPSQIPTDTRRYSGPLLNQVQNPFQNQQSQYGFNQLAENKASQPTLGTNPWATPAAYTAPQAPQYQQQVYPNPYLNHYVDYGYHYQIPTVNNYNRHEPSWDNYYTQPRQIPMPVVNWNQPQPINPFAQPVQYPNQFQTPQTTMNWVEISNQNWNSI